MRDKSLVENIRCINDLNLYTKLLKDSDVVKTNEWIDRESKKNPMSIRRHLLSSSVRLTQKMSPEIYAMAQDCIERLGVTLSVEIFVYSSPEFNAACFKPEDGKLYIMFSSSLLEGFTETELKYVMGHELGHHVYRHHDIPVGYLLKGEQRPNPRMALELFTWSRYAEISADRAGAYCAQDFQSVASALFKLSSGLTGDLVQFELNDFLEQIEDMQVVDSAPGERAPKGDWFSTHPFSPLRVKALQYYHESELAKEDGISIDELEVSVQQLMGLMEPSYLEGKTDVAEAMRRLLFSGSVAVAAASSGISEKEIKVFEGFFGKGAMSEKLNIEKIEDSVVDRALKVKSVASASQCVQVLRDLVLIARADGRVSKAEKSVIIEVAKLLSVIDESFMPIFEGDFELD